MLYRHSLQTAAVVLIETLWNVKLNSRPISIASYTVLIETLWNVKRQAKDPTRSSDTRINRNIVECKE